MATKFKKFLKSFTLIELIIVIAIIAVLGVAAFLVLSQWMSKSRDSKKISDLINIDNAINISVAKNDKLPKPDNVSKVMFSGSRIWDVGYFGQLAVEDLGGTLTKLPIDPTTKERYRYAQWNNQKYQLGTIIENEQYTKFYKSIYANSYFIKLQGNYKQSIIITKIDGVDTILPVPSLIVDEFEGEEKKLDEEHFWTNKGTYNFGTEAKTTMKVQSLYSGDLSKLSDTSSEEFQQFISTFEKVYSGTNFVPILGVDQTQDQIKVSIAQELSKVSSQPMSVNFLGCEGYNHGVKLNFYKKEIVGFGESCDSIKSQFECNNGNWIGEDKEDYSYASCNAQLPLECEGNSHGTKMNFYKHESVLYGQTCDSIKEEFECSNGNWIGGDKNEFTYNSCEVLSPLKCDGIDHLGTKDFYKQSSVAFGGTCDDHKKSFTCHNGIWMDGENSADKLTYKYSSCILGTPLNCNSKSFTYKSVTNLDVVFNVPLTDHGMSFTQSKNVSENNGVFKYNLDGACDNGNFVDLVFSNRQVVSCNSGYKIVNGACSEILLWSGDATNGFTFTKAGTTIYPKSCNDLLVSTNPNFKLGEGNAYNGTKFVDGFYNIRTGTTTIKAYCDMTTDGGGWTRFVNIKGNYTLENGKSCWLGTIINNTTLECFNPNRFSLLGTKLMVSTPRHASVKTKYFTIANTANSVSAKTTRSTYYCLGHTNYMTIMRNGAYPGSDGSNTERIRLGVNYCSHGGRQIGGRASTQYMNYSVGGTYGPTPGDRESSAKGSRIFIR